MLVCVSLSKSGLFCRACNRISTYDAELYPTHTNTRAHARTHTHTNQNDWSCGKSIVLRMNANRMRRERKREDGRNRQETEGCRSRWKEPAEFWLKRCFSLQTADQDRTEWISTV